jgi:hypothetical protein
MEQEMQFEDFYSGQTFESLRSYRVTAKEIVAFGERCDPQPSMRRPAGIPFSAALPLRDG